MLSLTRRTMTTSSLFLDFSSCTWYVSLQQLLDDKGRGGKVILDKSVMAVERWELQSSTVDVRLCALKSPLLVRCFGLQRCG